MNKLFAIVIPFALAGLISCGDDGGSATTCGAGTKLVDGECLPERDGTTCGPDTFLHSGECVPFDPSDETAPITTADPTAGLIRAMPLFVTLTTDEPARIYYTTDGTTPTTSSPSEPDQVGILTLMVTGDIQFFAEDLAGNTESVQTLAYEVDDTPPGPISDLAFTEDSGTLTLTWTNPSDLDYAGTLALRGADAPEPGTGYSTSDTIGSSTVVFAGSAMTTSESTPTGAGLYQVYAFDGLYNYSLVQTILYIAPVPEVPGDIVVAADVGAVTVSTQPSPFTLTGAATDNTGGSVTLTFTVTNGTGRPVYGTKVVIDSIDNGTAVGDGSVDTLPAAHAGAIALADGATAEVSFELTGVTTTSAINITARVLQNPLVFSDDYTDDTGTLSVTDPVSNFDHGLFGCRGSRHPGGSGSYGCTLRRPVLANDGVTLYSGNRNMPEIRVLDLTSSTDYSVVSLSNEVGYVSAVQLAAGGSFIVAALTTGAHPYSTKSTTNEIHSDIGTAAIVKLSLPDLTELGRVTSVETDSRTRSLALSPDGTRAAVVDKLNEVVRFVDLTTMEWIDTDVSTEELDHLSIPSAEGAIFSADGSELLVIDQDLTNLLTVVSMTDYAATTVPDAGENSTSYGIAVDRIGRVWIASSGDSGDVQIVEYNAINTAWELLGAIDLGIDHGIGIDFSSDGMRAYVASGYNTDTIAAVAVGDTFAELVQLDIDGDRTDATVGNASAGATANHWVLVTPF